MEGRYIQHLRKLGITSTNLTKESGAQRFFISFNWVCKDFPNREKFVKSGFPSWKKRWRKIAMKRYNRNQNPKSRERKRERIRRRANEIYELMFENPISQKKAFS